MDNHRASAILLLLVAAVKGQFNCCNQLEISSSGVAGNHQGNRLGIYHLYDVQDQRPIYKQEDRQEFLFYLVSNTKGLWMVGPHVGQFNGGLAHRGDNKCVQNVRSGQWKYTDGAAWHRDSKLKIACFDQTVDCLYKDGWDLEGSDLPLSLGGGGLATSSSAECIEECELRPSCHYWTFIKDNSTNCFLKMSGGELVQREGYLTGSIPKACGAPNTRRITTTTTERAVAKDDQKEKFNDKEINGKFKITSLKWNNKLNDKNSRHFRDLSASIEDSLLDMFHREKELNEKLNFTVTVEKFKKGSVVCNFKVNYALREAYVAIPFVIKPSNITDTLMKNFRFKKGILFQRFLIAAGSFNATSPVDHCAAKGCSHKCNYDYDIEDYVCTCPPTLALNVDQRTCVPKDQQNKNLNDQETDKPDTTTAEKTDPEQDDEEDNEVSNEEDEEKATTELNMKNNNQDEEAVTEVNDNNEVNTEPNEEENTEDTNEEEDELDEDGSPIVLTLLPADCLWSPWSLWTPCTCSGGTGQAERTRDVLMEERNGGACPGEPKQTVQCQLEEECPETDGDDVITQELDDDIITQELDEDDVTPTESSSDDDIFPDDGSIQFGEKLPKEGDENKTIDDPESTTIDIHDYETTLKPELKYKDSDTFRKEGDETADNINDDPDANDNDINNEEMGTTANPEDVTSGDEDVGNVQESNTDDEGPDDRNNDISKEVDESNAPNNSITFPDDDTKDEDNKNDDELTELFLPDIKNNATDTPLNTDNEIDTTPTNVSGEDEVTTDGNMDDINSQNDNDIQDNNDINDVIDNRFPESRIIDEETTTQKMDEAGNGNDSNNNDSEGKKMDNEETTTKEFPEVNNEKTSTDDNDDDDNDDTDKKEDSNDNDSNDNNENDETTTQKMDVSGNGIDSNSDEMTTPKMDEPGNGIDSNSDDVDGKMNEDENTTTPKMDEPGNGIDSNADDIDSKMKEDEDTTTKAIPELNNENDITNINDNDNKDKDNTLEDFDGTTTNSIPEDTTDMSNDKNGSKDIDEENNDSDEEDEENNNNTTDNILDEESQNMKEDNDSVQPSQVTQPSVGTAGDTTEDSSPDEEDISTIKSISNMNNADSDSTPFPILNQINGIDSDDETTTMNTETTIKAIPMSDILEVGDYPESDENTPTTPESTNSESNTNNPDTSETSEDSPITTESSSDDNPTTLDSSQDYPVTSESTGNETDEDYPTTSESNEDYPITSDDSLVTLESSDNSEMTSESNQNLPQTTESTEDSPTTSQSNEDSPVTSESGGDSPVTSESSQDIPTTSESSEENQSTPQSSEENLTTSESSDNNPTTSPSNQDNSVPSESSGDNPATSKSSEDGPMTTESSEDHTLTTESNEDSPASSESDEDYPITTESTEDNSITIESSQDGDNSATTESSQDGDNSATTESSQYGDNSATAESGQDGDVSATTESSFTTILVPLNEVTTMPTLDGKMGRNNLDNKDDENQTEGSESTTIKGDVLEMGDITTISSTLIEETTTDEGLLKFNCSESSRDDLNISSNQMPMDCILQNGLGEVTKKHVLIILNKDSFDSTRLFEDNIKLIAKNVMLMDMSKR